MILQNKSEAFIAFVKDLRIIIAKELDMYTQKLHPATQFPDITVKSSSDEVVALADKQEGCDWKMVVVFRESTVQSVLNISTSLKNSKVGYEN